jgi:hypothetical protein
MRGISANEAALNLTSRQRCDIQPASLIVVECFELITHFLPCVAVQVFSLALAVCVPSQIDNSTPAAIRPLVNAAFAVASTLAHSQPPVYARVHAPSGRLG